MRADFEKFVTDVLAADDAEGDACNKKTAELYQAMVKDNSQKFVKLGTAVVQWSVESGKTKVDAAVKTITEGARKALGDQECNSECEAALKAFEDEISAAAAKFMDAVGTAAKDPSTLEAETQKAQKAFEDAAQAA